MTPPKNMSASVRQRLLNRAKRDRRPFSELLQYHAVATDGLAFDIVALFKPSELSKMRIDIGFGDVVYPDPEESDLLTLLDFPPPRLFHFLP